MLSLREGYLLFIAAFAAFLWKFRRNTIGTLFLAAIAMVNHSFFSHLGLNTPIIIIRLGHFCSFSCTCAFQKRDGKLTPKRGAWFPVSDLRKCADKWKITQPWRDTIRQFVKMKWPKKEFKASFPLGGFLFLTNAKKRNCSKSLPLLKPKSLQIFSKVFLLNNSPGVIMFWYKIHLFWF